MDGPLQVSGVSEQRALEESRANLPGWQLQEAAPVDASLSQTSSQPPLRVAHGSDQLMREINFR